MILNRIIFFFGILLLILSFYLELQVPQEKIEKIYFSKVSQSQADVISESLKEKVIQPEIVNFKLLPCAENCDQFANLITKLRSQIKGKNLMSYQILDSKRNDVLNSGRTLNEEYVNNFSEALEKGVSSRYESFTDENGKSARQLVYFNKIDVSSGYVLLLRFDYSDAFSFAFYNYIVVGIFVLAVITVIVQSSKSQILEGSIEYIERLENEVKQVKNEAATKNQFLANFTHELRTPLNSIIGFSGMLKDETLGTLGNPEYIKFASEINNSGIHLLSIINDILDYSKAESGNLKVNIVETDVTKIIRQCIGVIAPRAAESKVELLESLYENHYIVKLDGKRFKQVLLNLLSNAVKFTPEGGSVKVSVYPDINNERIAIEIRDTGVGIAEKDIPTVMSLFGQVENQFSRRYEGTGIGLPFSKKLTDLMGGVFEIESQVGVGTAITLTFAFDRGLNSVYGKNSQ